MKNDKNLKKSFEEMFKLQNESIDKYGFFVHHVFPDNEDKFYCNYHTHGLEKTKNHYNFQIVLPIPPELAQNIFWEFVKRINEGEHFKGGTFVSKIIKNYDIELIETKDLDSGEVLLRVILPDVNGLFPDDDGCDKLYKGQKNVIV